MVFFIHANKSVLSRLLFGSITGPMESKVQSVDNTAKKPGTRPGVCLCAKLRKKRSVYVYIYTFAQSANSHTQYYYVLRMQCIFFIKCVAYVYKLQLLNVQVHVQKNSETNMGAKVFKKLRKFLHLSRSYKTFSNTYVVLKQ